MDNIRAEQKCNVHFSWGDPLAAARSETPKSRRAVRPCRVLWREGPRVWPKMHHHILTSAVL